MRRIAIVLVASFALVTGLVAAGNVGIGPLVITKEGSQQVILSVGPPRAVTEPGLSFRVPLLEEAKTYDRRLLYLNTEPDVIQTKDQERIVVDNYVMWRIDDPKQFLSSYPKGVGQAEKQIDRVVRAQVRGVVGQNTLTDVLTDKRIAIMERIRLQTHDSFAKSGVTIQDVRINRTELPTGIEANVHARMKTDRERLARKYRAEGEERARKIRAESDREARVTVAEARGKAEVTRGQGDAESAAIYAAAYDADPAFYAFVRSLEAYRKAIDGQTTLVLSPDSEFFQFFYKSIDAGDNPSRVSD